MAHGKCFYKNCYTASRYKWLVSKDTIHDAGLTHVAGLEIKTENDSLFFRVFNVGINFNSDKSVRLTTDIGYRTDWQRLE